jgi:signal transduction histidine kinase
MSAYQPERFSPELLSIISHELRGPLAAIKGYAATLRRAENRLSRAECNEFFDAIDEASDRLTLIIERILELSQLEMGLVRLVLAPVTLGRLVREAVAAAERRLAVSHEMKQRFTFVLAEGDDAAGVLVPADARYLRDVLDNLLENAIKYSPNGGTIAISLSPALLEQRGETARRALDLTISDQGIGIAGEHLARIFDTFQRVDVRSTRETEGLGLGLAICREIVDLHEGVMWAESAPGAGSTFHVVLPIIADPLDPAE